MFFFICVGWLEATNKYLARDLFPDVLILGALFLHFSCLSFEEHHSFIKVKNRNLFPLRWCICLSAEFIHIWSYPWIDPKGNWPKYVLDFWWENRNPHFLSNYPQKHIIYQHTVRGLMRSCQPHRLLPQLRHNLFSFRIVGLDILPFRNKIQFWHSIK